MKEAILFALIATAAVYGAVAQDNAGTQANSTITAAPLVSEPGADATTRIVRGGSQIRVQFLHEITT